MADFWPSAFIRRQTLQDLRLEPHFARVFCDLFRLANMLNRRYPKYRGPIIDFPPAKRLMCTKLNGARGNVRLWKTERENGPVDL